MKQRTILYCDASGNGYLIVVRDNHGHVSIVVQRQLSTKMTNNEYEYMAVDQAIRWLPSGSSSSIYTDSQLVANQLSLKWNIRSEKLRQLAGDIHKMIKDKELDVEFNWVPRKQNPAGKFLG